MYSPFLLARHTSRELGEMDRLPTGWLIETVAPSPNSSSGRKVLPMRESWLATLALTGKGA